MTVYTVHLPDGSARGAREGLDRAVLVKDGFHWPAFVFPLLWPLYHRLWLLFLVVLATMVGLGLAGRALGLPGWATGAVEFLMALFLGIAAGDLRSWGLARRGLPAVDVVSANTLDEAESRFFTRWLAGLSRRPEGRGTQHGPDLAQPFPGFARSGTPTVTGLFPETDRGRS